jgi:hypothetical protein
VSTSELTPTRIISSRYERALQTAQVTQERFSGVAFEIWSVYEFEYLALPDNVSTTSVERSPLVKDFWNRCDPHYRHREKAESFADFIDRVQCILKNLQEYDEDRLIVVFSHHQFIQAVRWLLRSGRNIQVGNVQPGDMRNFYEFLNTTFIPNGAILKTFLSREKNCAQSTLEIEHLHKNLNLSAASLLLDEQTPLTSGLPSPKRVEERDSWDRASASNLADPAPSVQNGRQTCIPAHGCR